LSCATGRQHRVVRADIESLTRGIERKHSDTSPIFDKQFERGPTLAYFDVSPR
jgi:hypothetical protein